MWNLKTETNSDLENKLMVTRGDGEGTLGEKDEGINYKLVVTE